MSSQKSYMAGTVEYFIDPKTGNRKSIFRGDKAYPDYDSAVKAARVLHARGHDVVAVDGEVVLQKVALSDPKVKSLLFKIRAFRKGNPRPVKFNSYAGSAPIAMQAFAIVTLFAGTPFDRFTFQAS